mgnify:CR=1 FL=1
MLEILKKLFGSKPKVFKTDIPRRFELLGRVGQGSMSKVWRARDSHSAKTVAVKVLDKIKTQRFEARFPGLKKPSEGEVAMKLKHPHIVETYEYGTTTEDEQFLVMEFVEGVSLTMVIDAQSESLTKNRLNYMIQLGEALEYFHREGWIHRDLCPRNIMVDTKEQIRLIDFGLVVPNSPDFRKPGNRTGTANYMAPELIKRHATDQRIDIFSYSVTCFEMWTKHLPWESAQTIDAVIHHINKPPTDIRTLAPGIDEEVAATIMKGLEREPADRWQTIAEMLVPLRHAQQRLQPRKKKPRPTTDGE